MPQMRGKMCVHHHLFHHPLAYLLCNVLEPRLLQGMRLAAGPSSDDQATGRKMELSCLWLVTKPGK